MEIKDFICVFKGCKNIKAGSFVKNGEEIAYPASKKVILGFFYEGKEVTIECKTDNDTFECFKDLTPYQDIAVDLELDFKGSYPKFILISFMEV